MEWWRRFWPTILNHADDFKTFLCRGRTEFRGHHADGFFRYHSRATAIAFDANLDRDVEEYRLQICLIPRGDFGVGLTLRDREVRRVDIGDRPSDGQPLT